MTVTLRVISEKKSVSTKHVNLLKRMKGSHGGRGLGSGLKKPQSGCEFGASQQGHILQTFFVISGPRLGPDHGCQESCLQVVTLLLFGCECSMCTPW